MVDSWGLSSACSSQLYHGSLLSGVIKPCDIQFFIGNMSVCVTSEMSLFREKSP